MSGWYLLYGKSRCRGSYIYRETWKYFHARLQTQLQFASLLHQFTDKHHTFPFQNGSLFYHHNPHSSRLSSFTPLIAVSFLTFHIRSEQDTCVSSNTFKKCTKVRFCYYPFVIILHCVFSCLQIHSTAVDRKVKDCKVFISDISENSFEAFPFFRAQRSEETLKIWAFVGK